MEVSSLHSTAGAPRSQKPSARSFEFSLPDAAGNQWPAGMVELDRSLLGGLKRTSQAESDRNAAAYLSMMSPFPSGPSDDAPQNLLAEVRVGGQVVASVYNSGCSVLSNEASVKVGKLDEPNLSGPELARWRASRYAEILGGTVTIAPTALDQTQWQPRTNETPTYTRTELDRAAAEMRQAGEGRHAAWLAMLELQADGRSIGAASNG